MSTVTLYGFKLSSASYRVRIALNIAGIDYDTVPVDLMSGEQKQAEHLARNPQGIVPALDIDGLMLTQSTAIIEYLDETRDLGFMPKDAVERQRLRALANAIAMEIQPICNSGLIVYVQEIAKGEPEQVRDDWMHKYIRQGLLAFETMLDHPNTGRFCHGDKPGLVDFCLMPQIFNANRWGADISDMTRINAIVDACNALPAFQQAHPEQCA
ncbi:MAG: maleylacetoacetate isomerase [Hyphomicrobiales bacterium]